MFLLKRHSQIYKHNVAQHVLSDDHHDQRLFQKSNLTSLLFGAAATADIVKPLGGEITQDSLKQKKKKAEKEDAEEEDDDEEISTEFDGVNVSGVEKVQQIEAKKQSSFEQSEDWVLQRLFKKAGAIIETAIDQRSIKHGGTSADFTRIDEEAKRVAKAAVAALHSSATRPKLAAVKHIGAKSTSALERIRARRPVEAELAAPLTSGDAIFEKSKLNPNYKLAQKLRDFLNGQRGGVKTDTLVAKFDGHINNSAVFKAVLKQIATLNKTTHRWSLRQQFRQ